ncbi:hypothetical protein GQ53DRAFT_708366 [Thozetella sp. PMI_491]|nr:hypothetical protein GQ53DRAFT_708366 [Thozetella sp. PMI_491]
MENPSRSQFAPETTSHLRKGVPKRPRRRPLILDTPFRVQPSQNAFQLNLFVELFVELYMPGKEGNDRITVLPSGWIPCLLSIYQSRHELLDTCLLSLCTGFVSRKNGDPKLAGQALELYLKSIQSLRQSEIWSTKTKIKEERVLVLIASTIILNYCESLAVNNTGQGNLAHKRGGLQLDPDYLIQKLVEIMISMPALIEHADNLEASDCSTKKDAKRVRNSAQGLLLLAWKLDCRLRDWHSEMSSVITLPTRIQGPSSLGRVNRSSFRVSTLQYAERDGNIVWSTYWSFSLQINLLIKQLQSRHASASKDVPYPSVLPLQLEQLGEDYDVLDLYAENIMDSLFTNSGDTADAHDATYSVFSLHCYWKHRRDEEKLRWCIDAWREIKHCGIHHFGME